MKRHVREHDMQQPPVLVQHALPVPMRQQSSSLPKSASALQCRPSAVQQFRSSARHMPRRAPQGVTSKAAQSLLPPLLSPAPMAKCHSHPTVVEAAVAYVPSSDLAARMKELKEAKRGSAAAAARLAPVDPKVAAAAGCRTANNDATPGEVAGQPSCTQQLLPGHAGNQHSVSSKQWQRALLDAVTPHSTWFLVDLHVRY